MMDLTELRDNRKLVNSIDWGMAPEKAVEMYLEWGTSWARGNDFVSSARDKSVYFVIYDWEKEPCATLILRTITGAEEIARVPVPAELLARHPGGKMAGCLEGQSIRPILP